jgi:predicted nucleic acid-binding protein
MIVSDTTPLSCLLKVGKADLLQELYGTVAIPAEVAAELDQAGPIHESWRRQLDFVRVEEPFGDDPVMRLLMAEIDQGEAAAIALVRRLSSELLIVDDIAGRRLARRLGLAITGTVGVILAAAERRLVDEPFAVLDELRTRGGLWLSDSFLENLRADVQPRCPGRGRRPARRRCWPRSP